jgi:insulysin
LQILKDLVDKDHYYSKFSTGNSKTLQTEDEEKLEWIRGALLAFHAKHYKPENFTVVIAGPQSLETLQDWVVSRFSQIEKRPFSDDNLSTIEELVSDAAKDAPPFSFNEPTPPYNSPFKNSLEGPMPILVTTKPVRSMRKLVLMFPMESDRKIPDQSPSSFLSHLLGHEGEGSAFAVLQNHGMISSLSAGARTSGPDFKLFQVDLELTEKGEKHWKEVVDLVFAYCRLINENLQLESKNKSREMRRIWGETSQLDRVFFDQTSPGGVYGYAPNLCQRIVAYGTEKCISAGSMLDEGEDTFPLDHIVETAKLLNPENCIVERCSEEAWTEAEKNERLDRLDVTRKSEQWYGVDYFTSQIVTQAIRSWKGDGHHLGWSTGATDLSLPRPNMYIPRTLDLCAELPAEAKVPRIAKPMDPPDLLINSRSGRLFHRLDDRYALPQSSFNILIRNAATASTKTSNGVWCHDASTGMKSTMLAVIFNQAMAQETYDAELAGLYWALSLGPSGIKLHCYGFSDRLPDLADKILGKQ